MLPQFFLVPNNPCMITIGATPLGLGTLSHVFADKLCKSRSPKGRMTGHLMRCAPDHNECNLNRAIVQCAEYIVHKIPCMRPFYEKCAPLGSSASRSRLGVCGVFVVVVIVKWHLLLSRIFTSVASIGIWIKLNKSQLMAKKTWRKRLSTLNIANTSYRLYIFYLGNQKKNDFCDHLIKREPYFLLIMLISVYLGNQIKYDFCDDLIKREP